MDDRLRRDGSENNGNSNQNVSHSRDFQQWDYRENIASSGSAEKINPSVQINKKFEVNIPESEDFPAYKPQTPTRVPAPVRRPSSTIPTIPVNRPSANGQKAPVRPSVNTTDTARPAAPSSAERQGAVRRPAAASAASTGNKAPENEPKSTKKTSEESNEGTRSKKAAKKKKNKADSAYNLVKGILISCVCFIFIATLTTVVSTVAFGFINDILVIDDENKDYSVVVEIPEGAEYEQIFDILTENGLVSQPLLTDFFLKFRHYDYQAAYDDETGELLYDENGEVMQEAVRYQPGVYYVSADSGIENIFDSMLVNNNLNKGTVRLTFPEGWSIGEVFDKIEKNEVCEAEKLYANLEIIGEQYSFIKKISDVDGRYLKAEGYLFPDTYDFYIGESASSVLKKLFNNFEARWEKEYNSRLKELGMSMDEIITIASIIQCEAKDGSQMAEISGVIHNRLNNAATYPTLDMDSTADYINNLETLGVLTDVQHQLYLEYYNTYSKTGLPPGPICNPGATAIEAALYPAESTYYFFCHGNDGSVHYASTRSEHEENVQRVIYGSVGGN